ncbi:MAG: DUF1800 domain-containing protein, partial [Puniceicoccales bacterium]|nr:DUF1800 domain-containing protein [Puniceicoccales bacterium]
MNDDLPLPPPEQAWHPLSFEAWDEDCACHLLRRMGFAATPASTQQTLRDGPALAVRRAFLKVRPLVKSEKLSQYDEDSADIRAKARALTPEERQNFLNEIRRKGQQAFDAYAMQWLNFARNPETAAQEKFVMFLQDIFVVARQKVRSPSRLFDYQETLRLGIEGDYPSLTKSVMRSPGMIQYLDLNQSSKNAPNEPFARELFELFTLGEGNYSEEDIKQAARALTGITLRNNIYRLDPKRHDNGDKTLFGKTGNWTPD